MRSGFDVIILGAGPAGCSAAYDLASNGQKVLLLDKRLFPRRKACACGLTAKAIHALRYSVEPVIERHCKDVVLQEAGSGFREGKRISELGLNVAIGFPIPFCAMGERERFDAFCLEQTLAYGEKDRKPLLRKIEQVTAVREFKTHIEIDVLTSENCRETLKAAVLVGADGSNGQSRRFAYAISLQRASGALEQRCLAADWGTVSAEPPWYEKGLALEACIPYTALPTRLPFGDDPLDFVLDFSPILGGYGWMFPKGNHINVGLGAFVPNVNGSTGYSKSLEQCEPATRSLLIEYIDKKLGIESRDIPGFQIAGQHMGLGGHSYAPEGRLLLAGDAAGLVDPLTGEGIYSAIVSGQAAAAAITEALAHTGRVLKSGSLYTSVSMRSGSSDTTLGVAEVYARRLAPLQKTFALSHKAAILFYREPYVAMKIMRTPILRHALLKSYTHGLLMSDVFQSPIYRTALDALLRLFQIRKSVLRRIGFKTLFGALSRQINPVS